MIISIVLLAGCSSYPIIAAKQQQITIPSQDESQVIFFRPSNFAGSVINAALYEVIDEELKFIGIMVNGQWSMVNGQWSMVNGQWSMVNGTKLSYTTTPGKHVFMVVSEAADFMEADLAPGKNYYSIVTSRTGVMQARFSLWPIKKGSNSDYPINTPKFDKWLKNTRWSSIQKIGIKKTKIVYNENKKSIGLYGRKKQLEILPEERLFPKMAYNIFDSILITSSRKTFNPLIHHCGNPVLLD